MIRPLLVLTLLAAAPRPAHGQARDTVTAPAVQLDTSEFAVWGVVRDEATGEPLANAMVRVDSTNLGVRTDGAGRYLIRHAERAGRFVLTLRADAEPGWDYYPEWRMLTTTTPNSGMVVVIEGKRQPSPGYLARLDFHLRKEMRSI